MSQNEERTTGIRAVLSLPMVYDFFQQIIGGKKARKIIVTDFIQPKPNESILDIGCGTAYVLDYINNDVKYSGYDLNATYIDAAKKRYGNQGDFSCSRVSSMTLDSKGKHNYVLALGLIHHLNDQEAEELFQIGYDALKPGGVLLTLDGTLINGQNSFARFLIKNDRGKHVRPPKEYQQIAAKVFDTVKTEIRHDMFSIPYTACVLQCTK